MEKKANIILSSEYSFARAVALGIIVKKPLSVWHYLIPGMFIFDFLRRTSEINRYTKHFLFPRRLAIQAAQDIMNGEERRNRVSRVEEEIAAWLNGLHLYSSALHKSHTEEIKLLIEHYLKLLHSEGNHYNHLVRNAYKDRKDYKDHMSRLARSEREVDRAMIEKLGDTQILREKLSAEEQQVKELREKKLDEIF